MKFVEGLEAKAKEIIEANQKDNAYSRATVDYAVSWADLIETDLNAGKKLADVAEARSHEASKAQGGITGFMAGWSASFLGKFWVHGEELRLWWNAQYGVSEEKAKGGTVNPAILTVNT